MPAPFETFVERWRREGLIDAATAERIRAFEATHDHGGGLRWPVVLALTAGGLLLGAAVLLFVAAHWGALGPTERFALVLAMVAAFHVGGAAAGTRFPPLSATLHAVGTASLGAGIFLGGQVFNLEEHWPTGVLLWAIGAALAWAALRDWAQAAALALLVPAWIGAEWIEAVHPSQAAARIVFEGALATALAYVGAVLPGRDSAVRRALAWIGGIALLPAAGLVATSAEPFGPVEELPDSWRLAGTAAALLLPTLLAVALRRRAAWINAIAAIWVLVLGAAAGRGALFAFGAAHHGWAELRFYLVAALGAVGLVAWGLLERARERVNLGIAGFGLTVLLFYFSSVMDRLDRAASLAGLGGLFLLGGWALERLRRRLVARLAAA